MSTDENTKEFFAEQLSTDMDRNVPEISFLDDLDTASLKLVELIMAAGTGQKDIIDQLRLTVSAPGEFMLND